jgi:hypothetical protein
MTRRSGIHPCLPVPLLEQRRLMTLGRLALAELTGDNPGQALADLHAAASVLRELVAGDRFTADARQTAQDARQAVESVWAGATLPAAALGPAMAAVELLESALPLVTLRRLEVAKVAAQGDRLRRAPADSERQAAPAAISERGSERETESRAGMGNGSAPCES